MQGTFGSISCRSYASLGFLAQITLQENVCATESRSKQVFFMCLSQQIEFPKKVEVKDGNGDGPIDLTGNMEEFSIDGLAGDLDIDMEDVFSDDGDDD